MTLTITAVIAPASLRSPGAWPVASAGLAVIGVGYWLSSAPSRPGTVSNIARIPLVAGCGMALGASSPPVAAIALFVNATAGQGGPPTATATLIIAGGLGFAASSALVILLLNVGRPATALSLGMLALILGASAPEPATLQALRRNAENSHLTVPVTPLPAAAGIIAIWLSLPHVTDTKGCRLNRPRIQSERPTCELSVVDGSGADHLRIVWKPTPPPGRLNG